MGRREGYYHRANITRDRWRCLDRTAEHEAVRGKMYQVERLARFWSLVPPDEWGDRSGNR